MSKPLSVMSYNQFRKKEIKVKVLLKIKIKIDKKHPKI